MLFVCFTQIFITNNHGSHAVESTEKVLNFKIGFQDLEKSIEFGQNIPKGIEKVWKFQMENMLEVSE